MNTYSKLKIQQNAIKIFVFCSGIGLTLYCASLCVGLRSDIAEFLILTLAYVLLGIAAWSHKLCWIAWAFIIYSYTVRCCMIVYRHGWFGEYIDYAHVLFFLIGAFLCLCFLFNIKRYKNE